MGAPRPAVWSKPVRPAGVAQSEARLLASGALLQQIAQGAGLLDDLRIPFTILMNGEPGANREVALGVIKSIRRKQ